MPACFFAIELENLNRCAWPYLGLACITLQIGYCSGFGWIRWEFRLEKRATLPWEALKFSRNRRKSQDLNSSSCSETSHSWERSGTWKWSHSLPQLQTQSFNWTFSLEIWNLPLLQLSLSPFLFSSSISSTSRLHDRTNLDHLQNLQK